MATNQLEVLAQIVLPSEILNYFSVVGVEQTSTEMQIHLDELMNPELSHDVHFESKGFMETVDVTDFPIRDHKVILKIRHRRWTDIRTGKSFKYKETLSGFRSWDQLSHADEWILFPENIGKPPINYIFFLP